MEELELELQHLNTLLKKRGNLKYVRELINKVEVELGTENGCTDDDVIRNRSISSSINNSVGENPNISPEVLDTNKTKAGSANVKSPLKNEYIMRMIFDLCSVTTLKSCRLVSTEWRDISFSSWRNKAVLRLSESGSKLRFKEFITLHSSENDFHQLRASPFKNYHFNFKPSQSQVAHEQRNGGKRVLDIASPNACHLVLSFYSETMGGFKKTILKKFTNLGSLELIDSKLMDSHSQGSRRSPLSYPNLKRLKIVNSSVQSEAIWIELLKCLPNLEALSVRSFRHDLRFEFKFAAGFMILLRGKVDMKTYRMGDRSVENIMFIPLKELEVLNMSETMKDTFEMITTYYFPLERLSLGMNGTSHIFSLDGIATSLHNSKFRDTLQYLRLSLREILPNLYDQTSWKPVLRKSQRLCFEALKELGLAPALPQGLYFLSLIDAPKLEKLTLEKVENDSKFFLYPESVSFAKEAIFERLNTLEFQDNSRIPSPKLVDVLANLMPNLLHLTIPLDKHSFHIVCRRFKRLRTLNILHGQWDYEEIDDECLTGVPVTMVAMDEGQGPGASTLPPNITDLKDLTDFTISCRRQLLRGHVGFTDHAVIYGFLKVPRLHNLSVAFEKLSEPIKTRLHAHVKGSIHIQEVQRGQSHLGYFDLQVYNDYGNDDDDDDDDDDEQKKPNYFDENSNSDETIDDYDGDNGNVGAGVLVSASENDEDESTNEECQEPEEDDASVEDEDLDGQIDSVEAENESSDSD